MPERAESRTIGNVWVTWQRDDVSLASRWLNDAQRLCCAFRNVFCNNDQMDFELEYLMPYYVIRK